RGRAGSNLLAGGGPHHFRRPERLDESFAQQSTEPCGVKPVPLAQRIQSRQSCRPLPTLFRCQYRQACSEATRPLHENHVRMFALAVLNKHERVAVLARLELLIVDRDREGKIASSSKRECHKNARGPLFLGNRPTGIAPRNFDSRRGSVISDDGYVA